MNGYRLFVKAGFCFLLFSLFISCGTKRTVPITNRTQRIAEGAFSDDQVLSMIKPIYKKTISQYGDSRNKKQTALVKKVSNRLIQATNTYLKSNGYANELKYYEWEVHLIKNSEANACCYPGGKILVYEPILDVTANEAGLAAVLGHEIGHAIAKHSAEKLTKSAKKMIWQQVGVNAINIIGLIEGESQETINEVSNSGVDLSNEIMQYVEMKYSRKQEHEADHIGMVLMAMAGYDSHEAPKVWTRMTQKYGDSTDRILSTHPSNAKRQRWMNEKWMDEAMRYYKPHRNGRQAKRKK